MRIATWNVNSIRTRKERVIDWVCRNDVDVLCMQETKCTDEQFPTTDFTDAGYEVAHVGLNQWNGVGIISRVGLDAVATSFPDQPGFAKNPDDEQKREPRAVGATCGQVRLWSIYVPNGRSRTDPHYFYKLEWLEKLRTFLWEEQAKYPSLIVAGDYNIAPLDSDVWDIDFFSDKTHVTEQEREIFQGFLQDGFIDPHRALDPNTFTWWDYQQLRFPRNEGMRIDFTLISAVIDDQTTGGYIDREERKGQGASDHAPVILDFSAKTV